VLHTFATQDHEYAQACEAQAVQMCCIHYHYLYVARYQQQGDMRFRRSIMLT
jgi:hypothetical protein